MWITWIDGVREVPGVGLMETGNDYLVKDALAQSLIKQKQAKAVKIKEEIEGRK